jgi:GNAT superfamily N-acetyltransferase
MTAIEVRPIDLEKDAGAFLRFPWKVYASDEHWVPPLVFERKEFFSKKHNPYFRHATLQCFIAYRNGEPVGTISAQVDHGYQEVEKGVGFFGFFDFVDDVEVARALLDAATSWLAERGMKRAMGPFNFNTNHECGLLVDGFDSDPLVLMTYNPPYYVRTYETLGLVKQRDLFAYWIDAAPIPPRIAAVADRFMERHPEVEIRPVNLSRFWDELALVKEIYNDAWAQNWGFVRLTDEEFVKVAKGLKPMVDPRLAYVAEVDGVPAAFSVTLPDFNQVVKPMNGRIFPFGWWHFLWGKRRVNQIRIFALGVKREYQHLALGAPLYKRTWEAGLEMGVRGAEASWILDDNVRMQSALEKLGARVYKTYRIYGTEL